MSESAETIEKLQELVAQCLAENERLREENRQLIAINQQLKADLKTANQKIQFLLSRLFGKKSEKLDPNQLLLSLNMDEFLAGGEDDGPEKPQPPESKRRERKTRKDRLPEDLPVERVVIDPDEVVAHPEDYKCIGEETLEELEVVPTRFFKRIIVRRKFVKRTDRAQAPIIAPPPARLIEKSFATPSLLTHIVISKYVDHLPLYRQEQILATRYGIRLSRKTMSGWMWSIADWLRLVYDEMKKELFENRYLQVDETFIKYLEPGAGRAQQGYLWAYHAPGVGVLYDWHASRSASCLEHMLKEYDGAIQTDGYQAYQTYNRQRVESGREPLSLFACWAHARRYFLKAEAESGFARWMLRQIQLLYRIEKRLRDCNAAPSLREAVRQAESTMILQRMEKALKARKFSHLPSSLTGEAVDYTLRLWEQLIRYTQDGRVEIDNNLVENAIRPTAVGKKNWLFFGSEHAGWQSAVLFSILETCRKVEINPQEYLLDVLTRLPNMTNQQIGELTPAKWLQARMKIAC